MITLNFIIICYGICNILIYGSLFEGFRNALGTLGTGGYSLYKLFTCFMCLATWVGIGISMLLYNYGYFHLTPMGEMGITNLFLGSFLNGVLASGGVWLTHTLQESLED